MLAGWPDVMRSSWFPMKFKVWDDHRRTGTFSREG